ncbi:MAG: hypothetical protein FWD27_00685 [Coriobacteriia bacterium]|nr:hypothetical protein [Coriobacteriia bacterium]
MDITKIKDNYSEARQQAQQFEGTFSQYQKLAGNVAARTYGSNPFPYGEGTSASLIIKKAQRVLKQMPKGKLRNIANEFMCVICEFIVEEIFFRFARLQEGLIQSCWVVIRDGLTFGFKTVTPYFTKVNGAYTVDFKMHYWADVFPAPGVKNINDGDVFIRDWWSEEDIKALIKAAGEDDTLDKKALKELLESKPSSRSLKLQSEANIRANVPNLGYEVVRYYVLEDGKYMLYIFMPGNSELTIQKKELPSRGHVTYYNDHDDLTAYGCSLLSLIGGIQIDLDQSQQSRRKAQELEIDPMLILRGYNVGKVQVKPGTLITLPQEAKLDPFKLETPSLLNYNQNHSADQALIFQIADNPVANVSGDVTSSAAIGKTPTAIKQAQSNIDAADNQTQHSLKLFLEQLCVESLKIYFHNLPETFLVEVSQEYVQRLMPIAPERFVQDGVVLVENELNMYDYEIDIDSGNNDVDAMKLDSVMKMLGLLEQSPMLAQRVMSLGIADDLIKEIVFASGLNNDAIAKKLSFLDSPNMGPPAGGDPFAGQPIPPEMAMQMAEGQGQPNPAMQTQIPNPIRQQGVM